MILNSPIERYTYLDTYMTFFKKNTYLYFSIVHKSLLGRLHNYGGAWLRYNYLEGTTIPRSYALPYTTIAAHSTQSNRGV